MSICGINSKNNVMKGALLFLKFQLSYLNLEQIILTY